MRRRHAWLLAAGLSLYGAILSAQKPVVAIMLPERTQLKTDGPAVTSQSLVVDGAMLDLLRNGFPARLHYRVERWTTGGWFDDIAAIAEWDVVVRYDALGAVYQVFRIVKRTTIGLGNFPDIRAADAALGAAFTVPISLSRAGRKTYYTLTLDIESLSLTELDEVERWLRGELKPAVRGQKNAGTAVGRGVRTVVVKLLGGEKRRYETRSGTFRP
ncbi:MAG: hypothetical protein ABIS03_07780 [Gemmatimonadaceae bacterium]